MRSAESRGHSPRPVGKARPPSGGTLGALTLHTVAETRQCQSAAWVVLTCQTSMEGPPPPGLHPPAQSLERLSHADQTRLRDPRAKVSKTSGVRYLSVHRPVGASSAPRPETPPAPHETSQAQDERDRAVPWGTSDRTR